ncbi:MAG: ABC transporter substrate-binding protein [Anaerolineae bacterium]
MAAGSVSRKGKLLVGVGVAAGLLALAPLLLRFGVVGRDPIWARIQERGVWRVGMDPSFPPFEYPAADGRPIGLDVDLAEAIAATWGVRVEIVGVGFDELLDAVHVHQVDSALSALPVVPHRTRDVSFSDPYIEAGLVLAVPDASELQGVEGLRGRRLAVEWGSNGDAEARALSRRWDGELVLVLQDSVTAALDAVLAGQADAALVDAISLALYTRREQLRTAGPAVVSDPYVVVVPADAPQLLQAVNRALAELGANSTLAEIQERWLRPGE